MAVTFEQAVVELSPMPQSTRNRSQSLHAGRAMFLILNRQFESVSFRLNSTLKLTVRSRNFLPMTSEACLTDAEACRFLSQISDHRKTPKFTLSYLKVRFRTICRNFLISGRRAVADTSIYFKSIV